MPTPRPGCLDSDERASAQATTFGHGQRASVWGIEQLLERALFDPHALTVGIQVDQQALESTIGLAREQNSKNLGLVLGQSSRSSERTERGGGRKRLEKPTFRIDEDPLGRVQNSGLRGI